MAQIDLTNPTLEFLDNDPSIAERFGASDTKYYPLHQNALL